MEYKIKTLNAISSAIYTQLDDKYKVADDISNPQAVLVRSASMHDTPIDDSVLCIARAGAGYNNIPVDACSNRGICVFNTPGANANAVAEMVLAGMLLSCRNIVGGIEWARTLKGQGAAVEKAVEKGKKAFVGPEIRGKTLGVVGLGAIGVLVANAAVHLGMNVTFVTGNADLDAAFVKEAADKGLVNLKGHRIVGGMRASIYNAMPMDGVKALVSFMGEFEAAHK